MWFWSRSDPSVPEEVRRGAESLHTESWGLPEAVFPADNCDMESHFGPHRIVINLTFCVSTNLRLVGKLKTDGVLGRLGRKPVS